MIDNISLQNALTTTGFYNGLIDGKVGPVTHAAMKKFIDGATSFDVSMATGDRIRIAAEQLILQRLGFYPKQSRIDGLVGPNTRDAWDRWQAAQRKATVPPKVAEIVSPTPASIKNVWPTQANVPTFYGARGSNQVKVPVPWKMYLAWDTSTQIKTISLHKKVADSSSRVFDRIHKEIGETKIYDLGLHLFGGSLNVRKMRNGTAWSMHSWGIAIDFDTERNQLSWGKDKARLGKDDAIPMWKIWEDEGWVSLGRVRNYDWQHVQAARL